MSTEPTDPTPEEPKKDDELTEEELDDASGGAGLNIKKPAQISIKKIDQKIGPTAPAFDPNKVMHSPNNAT